MICKYCGAQYKGNKCDACGKVIPLMKRSTDIDILMSGAQSLKPSMQPRTKSFEQGINEGYQKGLKEGYNNGYSDGVTASSQPRLPIKLLAILCASVFVVGAVLSGLIFGKTGYNNGYNKGTQYGTEQGIDTGIYIATSTYEPLLTENYNAGLEKGRLDGYNEGYAAARDELIASMATPSPTPAGNESMYTTYPEFNAVLEFPYSIANNGRTRNAIVKKIQTRLKDLEYKVDGKAIADDGLYGRNTENAVKQFQKDNGLEATGEVDLLTYQHLFPEEQFPIVDDSFSPNNSTFFPFTTPFIPLPITPPSFDHPTPTPTPTPTPSIVPAIEVVDSPDEPTMTPESSDEPFENVNDIVL